MENMYNINTISNVPLDFEEDLSITYLSYYRKNKFFTSLPTSFIFN